MINNYACICIFIIFSLERGAPNSSSCLLNQKLQMLNCCIEKKIARAQKELEKNNASEDVEMDAEEGKYYTMNSLCVNPLFLKS